MPPNAFTDRTMTAWLTGNASEPEVIEALRVIYVGVTRARKLLGLAVPDSHEGALLEVFHRHSIPTELRPHERSK